MAFVNLQRLIDLNKDQGEAMAQKTLAGSGAGGALTSAEFGVNNYAGGMDNSAEAQSRIAQAQAKAKTLGTTGGMAAALGKATGQPAGALDAALMGQSGAMAQYRARTNNLAKLMEGAQQQHDARLRHEAAMRTPLGPKAERPESPEELQARLYREQLRSGGYNPQSAEEYAAYSDYIQSGRR